MTSRDRVVAAIEFRGPDRVPHAHAAIPAAWAVFPHLAEWYRRYPADFEAAAAGRAKEPPRAFRRGRYTDEWGCVWTVPRDGYLGQVTTHPLAEFDRLRDYCWPAVTAEPAPAPREGRTHYRLAGWLTTFERMIGLCGFEKLLVETAAGNPAVPAIRDRVVEYNLAAARKLLRSDPDGIFFADDWGTQHGLMVAPATWREVFLPAYRRMFGLVREAGRHVFFHTDGCTMDILPDLVASGVNVFWADLTLNALGGLHDQLGGKVCFQALTDVQFVLRSGTVEQVRRHARDIIAALGCFNGGLIACHEVAPDQPWRNVAAILQTFHDGGRYPLTWRWDGTRAVKRHRPVPPGTKEQSTCPQRPDR